MCIAAVARYRVLDMKFFDFGMFVLHARTIEINRFVKTVEIDGTKYSSMPNSS